jgi:uncharacterized protein YcfJ
MNRQAVVGLLAGVILVGSAAAGVIPGRWEKVDSLREGEDIVVVMKSGERIEGDFQSADVDSITVKPIREKDRRIVKAEVTQVEREGVKQDGALDGAAIGAGAGAGLGILFASVVGEENSEYRHGAQVLGVILGAAVGFGVGYGVDSMRGKPVLLYQAAP